MKKDISAGAIFLLSAVYFFDGFTGLAALISAVTIHELGHITAILSFGGKIKSLDFKLSGMSLAYSGIKTAIEETICLAAGPAAGFLLAYIASIMGSLTQNIYLLKTSGLSFILSVYNILPALPLDGGRFLKYLCGMILNTHTADIILDTSGILTGAFLLFTGAIYIRQQYGLTLIIAGVWILIAQTGIVKTNGML